MNWLAHLFLSEQNINFQLGNILADPLKAKSWENASYDLNKGMSVHKMIDAYADSHEIVQRSKNRLREKGLLRAVIVDLTYDYFLSKNWNMYCNISLKNYTNDFYIQAQNAVEILPNKANGFVKNLIKNDILNKYNSIELLEIAFKQLDKRLSARLLKREPASLYFNEVYQNIEDLENDFLEFFPLLCVYVKQQLDVTKLSHWKI